MVQTLQHTQNSALKAAINVAIPQLEQFRGKVRDVPVAVDGVSGFKQTGCIDPAEVRSLLVDIGVTAQQRLPESFMLYMPKVGSVSMELRALNDLISHLQAVARGL